MTSINRIISILAIALLAVSITACSPEIGSEQWCSDMKNKPTGDWSANQAADYAKHCLLK